MTSYSDTLQRGDTISCYQIEEVLGRGGFAVTYLAVDLNLDVHVAIKEYLPSEIIHRDERLNVSARRPEFAEDYNIGLSNFAREAKTLARFKHLNIVRVHQVLHKYNTAYMVMDYEHGQELADVLQERKTLPEDELREILFPIFDGVQEIHNNGLAHRDIKPSNIYLRENGSPVLLDFGSARYTMSETTQQLTAVVTVGYTPIEQYNVSDNDQGPWSDIYALAAVLYEAVTGEMPVDSVTRASSSLTNSPDPLTPVANKAQGHYSEHFLNAIDWGLNMEAQDRPQSIAQWRDAFNGVKKPADSYQAPQRPVRKSKLKTRARDQGLAEQPAQAASYQNDPRLTDDQPDPRLSVDVRDTRFDPNFDKDLDDVEIVSLNPTGPVDEPVRPASANQGVPPNQSSPFANNPAPKPDDRESAQNQTLNDTLNNIITSAGTKSSHSQELRKVLRRDIVRRDGNSPMRGGNATNAGFDAAPTNQQTPSNNQNAAYHRSIASDDRPITPPRRSLPQDDFEFDDADWDYEGPPPASKWKWLIPVISLAAVAGAALFFVNKPDLFSPTASSGPDMTIETALSRAQEKMQSQQVIFPTGESALDYYQLILASDPTNLDAQDGIASIRQNVTQRIIENVDNDNMAEANRLLSRANQANLQIDGLSDTPGSNTAEIQPEASDASPWVQSQIEDIEALLDDGDHVSARAMFDDLDKYIADARISTALNERIESVKRNAGATTVATDNNNNEPRLLEQPLPTEPLLPPVDAPVVERETPLPGLNPTISTGDPVIVEEQVAVAAPPPPAPAQLPAPIPEVEQKIAVNEDPATLPSAPRRSFIEGNDATSRHLNQLRRAIETKSLQRVQQVSDALPTERTEFLRRLFQRYDRLDVTIDNINRSNTGATAMLSVAMFNQRDDGSYYSAGKWNDVRLSTAREAGEWQPIKW